MTKKEKKHGRLIPLTKWHDYHDYPTYGSWRFMAFDMPPGMEKVIKRINGRVLIDEDAWFEYVETNSKHKRELNR